MSNPRPPLPEGPDPSVEAQPGTPPPPPPGETPDSHSTLKEWTTSLIGGGIVLVTLVLAVMLFLGRDTAPQWTPARPPSVPAERYDPFTRGKDVLLLLLPLAGAMVGYYTGRVIADNTVQQANANTQQAANTAREANQATAQANASAQGTRTAAQQVVRQIGERALDALAAARSVAARPGEAALREKVAESREFPEVTRLDQTEREIRELMNQARGWA